VACWGYNFFGELGDGGTANSAVPVAVSGLTDATQISAGYQQTCVRRAGGGLSCWGSDRYGELGDGGATNSSVPVAVIGFS
jgi:alpha-tubulin suppressor-like RCC1 family protein